MGQQQVLLIVLGIVITGIAVAVGIDSFDGNNRENRRDVAVAAGLRYSADLLGWYDRLPAMGGGGNSWENFGLHRIGYAPSGTCSNGRPYLELADGSHLAVTSNFDDSEAVATWLPNGDCDQGWEWEFNLYLENATVAGVKYVGCADNDPDYPESDGSECPEW